MQLNAAQSNGSCPDPRDTQPYFIECGDANTTTCSTKLRVQNNCTLNIRLLVYGVLAADAQPGYCVNLATRQGEACLRSALTYTAGQADTGDTYAFEGLYQDGLHYYAWWAAAQLLQLAAIAAERARSCASATCCRAGCPEQLMSGPATIQAQTPFG